MPGRLSRSALGLHIVSALQAGGYSTLLLDAVDAHPLRLAISRDQFEQPEVLRVYCWNITHGGGSARAADEFRIQLTGAMPELVPNETTVVIGWSEQFEVFAGWDEELHTGRVSISPSLQVRRETLERAWDEGLQAAVRHSGDVVVAFTPSLLATYCLFADELRSGGGAQLVSELNNIPMTRGGLPPVAPAAVNRPKVIRIVESNYRAWDFNSRVMKAYENRCAVCGLQLGLIEAAHIVPVVWPGSTDATCNGIALCRNHHRAYDAGLLSIRPDYIVELSPTKLATLTSEGRGGRTREWNALNGKSLVVVPAKLADRPDPGFLDIGRTSRGWTI